MATDLCNRIAHQFFELRETVPPTVSPELQDYLTELSYVLRANIEYGMGAKRYSNPDSQHPGAIPTRFSVTDTSILEQGKVRLHHGAHLAAVIASMGAILSVTRLDAARVW